MAGEWKLKERDVTRQITDFLKWRGWRLIRNNVTKMKDYAGNWTSYGEVGMPDYLAVYYCQEDGRPGLAACLWVEFKQLGKKLRPNQILWHRDELTRGACVVVADEFDQFEKFYWENFAWLHHSQGQCHLFQQT